MKQLLWLVSPKDEQRYNWDLREMAYLMGKKALSTPLALPLLAALTPDDWDVEIFDENIRSLKFSDEAEIVAITVRISGKERAFYLADRFRAKGVTVILGGPEVSDKPELARRHADSIVIGEAENLWSGILDDYAEGNLKAEYRSSGFCDFNSSPVPRWDLVETSKVLSVPVQVSRGCPYACDFCNVRYLFGRKFRYRNAENVIEELSLIPEGLMISFADDNFTADRAFVNDLLDRMISLGLRWNCQASIDCAFDLPLLDKMKKAGCTSLLIGIESLDPETLRKANKNQNDASRYLEAIENIQSRGIFVNGAFIAGFDNDTDAVFDGIIDFVETSRISHIMLNALYAYPHSPLYSRMKDSGRILGDANGRHTGIISNILFDNFPENSLSVGILTTLKKVYSWDSLRLKGQTLLKYHGFHSDVYAEVSGRVKFLVSRHFLFRYILFAGNAKRRYFFAMIRLIRRDGLSTGTVMQYMLFNDSINSYLRHLERVIR